MAYNGKLVTVFGGSGFVGRYVVSELAKRGYRIRVAVRRPDLAGHLQPLGNVGQIAAIQANLRYRWSVDRAVEGADHVVNLVAILHQTGKQRFDSVQVFGARAVAEAARAANVPLVHVSAIGADAGSSSMYAQTKAAGEAAVLETLPDAVIMRPSIIFGTEDAFFNRFAAMAKMLPVLPLVGAGTRFQPVHVGDVGEAVAKAVDGEAKAGATYELGGPEVKTFRELMQQMLKIIGRNRPIMNIPFPVAKVQGTFLGLLPNPPLTADQVELLKTDNVVSEAAMADERTFEGLGIKPATLASVLPSYLYRYREYGQYSEIIKS